MDRAKKWSEKRGIFFVVLVFAATPLPDDVTGIIAGAIGYNFKKFFLAALIGKLLLFWALAWAGYFGSEWVLGWLAGGI